MRAEREPVDRLRGYLRGTLAEADCEELERELLRDDELYEQLVALEDEAVHDWARGERDIELAAVVERLQRTTAGRRRLGDARLLVEGLRSDPRRAAVSWRTFAAVAAGLLLVLG